MKKIILILAVMTTFSFSSSESNRNQKHPKFKNSTVNPIDQELNFKRVRYLKDNTLLQKTLNNLVNNYSHE